MYPTALLNMNVNCFQKSVRFLFNFAPFLHLHSDNLLVYLEKSWCHFPQIIVYVDGFVYFTYFSSNLVLSLTALLQLCKLYNFWCNCLRHGTLMNSRLSGHKIFLSAKVWTYTLMGFVWHLNLCFVASTM